MQPQHKQQNHLTIAAWLNGVVVCVIAIIRYLQRDGHDELHDAINLRILGS